MSKYRSFRFTHTISRKPANSCIDGIKSDASLVPDYQKFLSEHDEYIVALKKAGVDASVLPADEAFPDSVFVEDPALCIDQLAIVLRPGAESRFGEASLIKPDLEKIFGSEVIELTAGFVDGGDILMTDQDAFIGLSTRTNLAGVKALEPILVEHGYTLRLVNTPEGVLHFKSDCALLDEETLFATKAMVKGDCFGTGYRIIEAPEGEESVANLIRVNDYVIMRSGFPRTQKLLEDNGYATITLNTDEAAKLDGGLSCMSLRFSL